MKYKIGNVDVEAVQWDGQDFTEILEFLDLVNISCKISTSLSGEILYLEDQGNYYQSKVFESDWIVKSKDSLFTLSEQDFNNMVTKMKEPKFEVGDKVYWLSEDCEGLSVDKVLIQKIISDKNSGIIYDVGAKHTVKEKYLLTLEEAIEKLKEL